MPSFGQTWVLASIGAVVEMDILSSLKKLLMESSSIHAEGKIIPSENTVDCPNIYILVEGICNCPNIYILVEGICNLHFIQWMSQLSYGS
jgi:hypothetical protein